MTTATEDDGEHSDLIGQVLAERYRIEALLGLGGMGAVYRAEHVHMRKTVAVKILHREMTASPEVVKRFEREAIVAGQIAHPNVAGATDFGRLEDGSFYLVLEFVPGQSLSSLLKEQGALPVERALPIARQIISALAAAHAAGVVHRDLKPDNVMLLDKDGAKDAVKVLDFGIAKIPVAEGGGTQLTQMGAIFGTPQYMAPEQASGAAIDERADLYSFGLLVHEMLTGRTVFDSSDIVVLLTMQLSAPAPPLPEHVPVALRELVAQLLEKERERRPASALEVGARLDSLASPATELVHQATVFVPAPAHGRVESKSLGEFKKRALLIAKASLTRARRVLEKALERGIIIGRRPAFANFKIWQIALPALLLVSLLIWIVARDTDASGAKGTSETAAVKPGVAQEYENTQPSDDDDEGAPPADEPLDAELAKTVELARLGGDDAISAIEQRNSSQRSAREWLALAQGYLRASRRGKIVERVQASLDAYRNLLELDERYGSNQLMLNGLRYYGVQDTTSEQVLEFAAEHMGSNGADLLFDIWAATSLKTPATVRAGELLETSAVKRNMSEALRLAFEIRAVKECEELKELLPRIEQKADRRSVLPMREFAKTTGCGSNRRSDCYPCLRDDSAFRDALAQVEMRKTPRFERRFR